MESLDDLLDFASDIGEEDDDVENNNNNRRTKSLKSAPFSLHSSRGAQNSGIVEEEELEWISNKDAFPKFESFVDIIPNNLNNNQSPVSVLENITNSSSNNNNFKVPVRARSKTTRKKRREQWQDCSGWGTSGNKSNKRSRAGGGGGGAANNKPMESDSSSVVFGRKCRHCQTEKTPQWRAGPTGPKTLCNACGVRYKSGRLVPEYRPASSPTFSTELHSNSHRKVLEMRRQKQMGS